MLLQLRSRNSDGTCTLRYSGPGEVLAMADLGLHLSVDALYADLELDRPEQD